jgi:uncharacterized protein (DUF433 family)
MSDDPRFSAGLMNLAEGGRYLHLPRQTFHRWARGYERGKPLIHVRSKPDGLPVMFVTLAEAHVLDALREAGVRAQKIRPALDKLKDEFGRDYVLVAKELATDGVEVLWDFSRTEAGRELIVSATGQGVMREIVQDYMSYISWDDEGYPLELQPRHWSPSKVSVDVRRSFGQPIFAGSGVRVADVASMMRAGETAETVAEEFGIDITDARTAARILLGRAA